MAASSKLEELRVGGPMASFGEKGPAESTSQIRIVNGRSAPNQSASTAIAAALAQPCAEGREGNA